MSSLESASKRRCVIQKLDFENCIVTSIRTKSRVRKKLRARITREFEQIDETQGESNSPLTTRTTPPPEAFNRGDKSPVFFKKKKRNVKKKNESSGERSSSVSPVFKLKMNKLGKSEEVQKTARRMTSVDLFSQGSSNGQSCQIEEFTQESKQSVKISSVDSGEIGNKSSDYSLECKSDSSAALNISWDKDSLSRSLSKWLEARELNDSFQHVRKNYKKNTHLGRLQRLLQKQASEKLLWQHQNRGNSSCSLKFAVGDFWKEEFIFFLKCRSLEPERDVTFLVVDSKWVPNVKNIRQGSVLQLYPPWQKLSISKPPSTVLLNVICLDILEEIQETSRTSINRKSIPVDEFESDSSLFINSLFINNFSKFLI